jgi:8-oxo-dGTP diphosphatase
MSQWAGGKIPYVGIGAIITRDRQLLLMRRRGAMGNQSWSTPGGYLEFEESFSTCAGREAAEEVGYVGQDFSFLAVTNDLFEARHFVTIWMISAAQADWSIGSVSDEVAEADWFSIDALPNLLFAPFNNLVAGVSDPGGAFARFFER